MLGIRYKNRRMEGLNVRGMRRKLKTKIIVLAILKCFLMLYFVYLHPDSRIGYWRMLIGGLQADSKFIFFVMLQVLPDFLLYHYVSRYIWLFKENYVFMFVRQRNIKYWVRNLSFMSLFDILFYEILACFIFFLAEIGIHGEAALQPGRFAVLFLYQVVKLADLTLFCNILLFRFHELTAMYANLVLQVLPLFVTGILYDMEGEWKMAVKYIPLNWCNFNYVLEAGLNPAVMLCLSIVAGVLLYWCMQKLIQNYEML